MKGREKVVGRGGKGGETPVEGGGRRGGEGVVRGGVREGGEKAVRTKNVERKDSRLYRRKGLKAKLVPREEGGRKREGVATPSQTHTYTPNPP